jgi:hypothetical protein
MFTPARDFLLETPFLSPLKLFQNQITLILPYTDLVFYLPKKEAGLSWRQLWFFSSILAPDNTHLAPDLKIYM